jgi:predicted Fe-S protein YdhL (DUF1289 family)
VTPDERTRVLQAILDYDVQQTFTAMRRVTERQIPCPTSWLNEREKLGASAGTSGYNWHRLSNEEKLRIWLEAPDSDYEYARDKTHIMEPKGSNLR